MRKTIASVVLLLFAVPVGANADHKARVNVGADRYVKAGAHKPGDPRAPWTYTKFYPHHLKIHPGMLVAWEFEQSFAGLHAIHFEIDAQGRDVERYKDPHPTIRADEIAGRIAIAEKGWALGSENGLYGQPCGRLGRVGFERERPRQGPCVLGTAPGEATVVGSGLTDNFFSAYRSRRDPRPYDGFPPFAIRFSESLPIGTYSYFCKYHPDMNGTVEIVDRAQQVPTQAQIDAAADAEIRADAQKAQPYFDSLLQDRQPTLDEEGKRVWSVDVGGVTPDGLIENGSINFLGYFPSTVADARPGDVVEFAVKGDEWQTVTFPTEGTGGLNIDGRCYTAECDGVAIPWGTFLATFSWGCEVDDPQAGLSHLPIHVPLYGCPTGLIEWLFGPNTEASQRAPRDQVTTPATYHNSGLMLAGDMPGWANSHPTQGRWPSTFRAELPNTGTFTFNCLIHPQAMEGSVIVG